MKPVRLRSPPLLAYLVIALGSGCAFLGFDLERERPDDSSGASNAGGNGAAGAGPAGGAGGNGAGAGGEAGSGGDTSCCEVQLSPAAQEVCELSCDDGECIGLPADCGGGAACCESLCQPAEWGLSLPTGSEIHQVFVSGCGRIRGTGALRGGDSLSWFPQASPALVAQNGPGALVFDIGSEVPSQLAQITTLGAEGDAGFGLYLNGDESYDGLVGTATLALAPCLDAGSFSLDGDPFSNFTSCEQQAPPNHTLIGANRNNAARLALMVDDTSSYIRTYGAAQQGHTFEATDDGEPVLLETIVDLPGDRFFFAGTTETANIRIDPPDTIKTLIGPNDGKSHVFFGDKRNGTFEAHYVNAECQNSPCGIRARAFGDEALLVLSEITKANLPGCIVGPMGSRRSVVLATGPSGCQQLVATDPDLITMIDATPSPTGLLVAGRCRGEAFGPSSGCSNGGLFVARAEGGQLVEPRVFLTDDESEDVSDVHLAATPAPGVVVVGVNIKNTTEAAVDLAGRNLPVSTTFLARIRMAPPE